MKIFDTKFQSGSLQEEVSGELMTNNLCEFKKTSKGMAPFFSGDPTSSRIDHSDIVLDYDNDNFSILFSFKRVSSNVFAVLWGNSTSTIPFFYANSVRFRISTTGGFFDFDTLPTETDKEYIFSVICDSGTVTIKNHTTGESESKSVTGTQTMNRIGNRSISTVALSGYIHKITAFDEALSQKQLEKEVQNLNFTPILGETHRNFHYPKPIDLSSEVGIDGAYNMIPSSGGVLVDITGNHSPAIPTVKGMSATKEGVLFNKSAYYDTGDIYPNTEGAFTVRMKNIIGSSSKIFLGSKAGNDRAYLQNGSDGSIRLILGNTTTVVASTDILPDGEEIVLTALWRGDGLTAEMWVNGELVDSGTQSGVVNQQAYPVFIGALNNLGSAILQTGAELHFVKIHNTVPTENEIKKMHNELFNSQVSYVNNLIYAPADGITKNATQIEDAVGGTGTFAVKELQADDPNTGLKKGQKYIECVNAGTIVFQNSFAYWTPECFINQSPTSAIHRIAVISNTENILNSNWYILQKRGVLSSSGALQFIRRDWVAFAELFLTIAWYTSTETRYWFRLPRDLDWEFTLKIKGGVFGNVYQNINVSGWLGTNPLTDNTYTTSNYIVADLDAGDQYIPWIWLRWIE